jgi:hypothetical protein
MTAGSDAVAQQFQSNRGSNNHMPSIIKKKSVGAILAVALIALTSCGSDDDSSADATTPAAEATTPAADATTPAADATTPAADATTPAADATTPAADATTPAAVDCSGDPIVLSVDGNFSTDPRNASEGYLNGTTAAVAAVNAECKLGRPLEILQCDTKGDPNIVDECARAAVDAKVLATVQPLIADSAMAIYEAGGIPAFGDSGNGANSLSSKLSFPTFPVIPTVMAFAAGAKLEGAETAQLVTVEGPSSQFNIDITNKQLVKFGIETTGVVAVPLSATDLTVYAGQILTGGADAVLFELGQDMTENLLKSLSQQGMDFTKTQVWNGGAIVTQKFVDEFDGSLEGVYTAGPFWPATDPSNPGIAKMLKELEDAGLPTDGISDWETTSWNSIHVLNEVLQGLDTIDSPSLIAALNTLVVTQADYPETAGYDFTKPAIPDDPVLSQMRIFNRNMYIAKIVDGKITPQYPDFIDPLADI